MSNQQETKYFINIYINRVVSSETIREGYFLLQIYIKKKRNIKI